MSAKNLLIFVILLLFLLNGLKTGVDYMGFKNYVDQSFIKYNIE